MTIAFAVSPTSALGSVVGPAISVSPLKEFSNFSKFEFSFGRHNCTDFPFGAETDRFMAVAVLD
ncbi:NADPH--sulfite reductase flavoprotein alpha-component [Corchorus olitorius]|uniref:NADPH--sulfite reductase flavoprotein alpha-component n=1 Tax=Corchorus olitorius TaxID=93759 RepID=A0A1R3L467_9ROSI|nr:NADPH--sulfite reductase flavoprotein alpha-component [Corchorus olitorius]